MNKLIFGIICLIALIGVVFVATVQPELRSEAGLRYMNAENLEYVCILDYVYARDLGGSMVPIFREGALIRCSDWKGVHAK